TEGATPRGRCGKNPAPKLARQDAPKLIGEGRAGGSELLEGPQGLRHGPHRLQGELAFAVAPEVVGEGRRVRAACTDGSEPVRGGARQVRNGVDRRRRPRLRPTATQSGRASP